MEFAQMQDIARALGFDAVGALPIEQLREVIRAHGERFSLDVGRAMQELEGAGGALVLAYPFRTIAAYPEGVPRVSHYYAASQKAYVAARELAARLDAEGMSARHSQHMPMKVVGQAAGLGRYGSSSLLVRQGAHMALQAVILQAPIKAHKPPMHTMDCASCGACERACPTGALAQGRVDRARCLRSYMEGEQAPADIAPLMGDLLLGCDACLNACPDKERIPYPDAWRGWLTWDNLLDEEAHRAHAQQLGALVGKNYINPLRRAALRWQERQMKRPCVATFEKR